MLRLNRPQPAVAIPGDQVDARVRRPSRPGHSSQSQTFSTFAAYSGAFSSTHWHSRSNPRPRTRSPASSPASSEDEVSHRRERTAVGRGV